MTLEGCSERRRLPPDRLAAVARPQMVVTEPHGVLVRGRRVEGQWRDGLCPVAVGGAAATKLRAWRSSLWAASNCFRCASGALRRETVLA